MEFRDATVLEVIRNVTANGRLFCLMLFVTALTAFALGFGVMFAKLAVLSAVPVGVACLADQMPHGRVRQGISLVFVYLLPAVIALVLFFAIR